MTSFLTYEVYLKKNGRASLAREAGSITLGKETDLLRRAVRCKPCNRFYMYEVLQPLQQRVAILTTTQGSR